MSKKFNNKVVWITGASSGIGEATAYRFAQEGARVIVTALEADLLEGVVNRCKELGAPDAAALPFDLSDSDGLDALAEKAWNQFGGIDVLYNNAGISQRGTTVETEMRVIRKVMDIDYYAPVILTKNILPRMIERGGGQLVVTTSIAGRFGFPLRCAYSSAKQHGKMDAGQAGGVTPQQAADKIVKAVYKKKREVLVGRYELLMAYIKQFCPGLAAKLARRIKPM